MISRANLALAHLKKRADESKVDPSFIRDTFVDVANTITLLRGPNHQILLGRRGSGKTHTLLAFADNVRASGDLAVFVDVKRLGSDSSWFDPDLSLSERGTRLFLDIAGAIREELRLALYDPMHGPELLNEYTVERLDRLAVAVTEVRLDGSAEASDLVRESRSSTANDSLQLNAGGIGGSSMRGSSSTFEGERHVKEVGRKRHYVHFGQLQTAMQDLVSCFRPHRVWLLLDEWSMIPAELQPYVGDLLRRALMNVSGLVVKISAVQHRSSWRLRTTEQSYIGFELGSDIFPDLNLDDLQVGFGRQLARKFFRELIFKHVVAELSGGPEGQLKLFDGEPDFLSHVFSSDNAFEEFVDSAEGVPRDGMCIIGLAAATAANERISVRHIRDAARRWHDQSKVAILHGNGDARRLMNYIVDTVIGDRKSRGFVVRQSDVRNHALFSLLVDERLLHCVRQSISSHDEPGVRFDAYVVDYGFYVNRTTGPTQPLRLALPDMSGKMWTCVKFPLPTTGLFDRPC